MDVAIASHAAGMQRNSKVDGEKLLLRCTKKLRVASRRATRSNTSCLTTEGTARRRVCTTKPEVRVKWRFYFSAYSIVLEPCLDSNSS